MPEPLAIPADVAARWRPLTDDEILVAARLIQDATDIVQTRWPDVEDRLADGSLRATSLTRVIAHMVKRAMIVGDNEGRESRQQTAGPYSINETFSNPTANLFLTAEDIRLLGGPSRRAFAVDQSSNVTPSWVGVDW